ncbi:MAG: rRNA maturation RNase YbeY [Pseudomonadota bacterium]
MNITLDVVVSNPSWPATVTSTSWLQPVVATTLAQYSWPKALRNCELSFNFTDDATIAELNTDFLQQQAATNVLSFPTQSISPGNTTDIEVSGDYCHLGDIVLAHQYICTDATNLNLNFEHHLIHLIVHSILHLLGYDHLKDSEAEQMEAKEIAILKLFSIENPYQNN